jgi:selenocysteine-specific translation elongation factor
MVDSMGEQCIDVISVSAETGEGLEELKELMVKVLKGEEEKPWEDFQ